jgi:hypothetical protein
MSQFYKHPYNTSLDLYDPLNNEYEIVDQTGADHIKINSPYILWWKIDQVGTKDNNDELSNLYNESDMMSFLNISSPVRVYAFVEYSPIINELTKIGLVQVKEINFISNITDIFEKLGREPKPGDVFRVSQMTTDGKDDSTFYTVVSVSPIDLHLFRYTNYLINAEATNMYNIPSEIKNYVD